jgi:hypothetical protein
VFHFVLLASVPFVTPHQAERLEVAVRHPYPPEPPYGKGMKAWNDFAERWGPLPPWQDFPPWANHRSVESGLWEGTAVDVGPTFIDFRKKGVEKAVRYSPHSLLASGRVVPWESDQNSYLLQDVKAGDEVQVRLGVADNIRGEECFTVRILKRPGGKVPAPRKLTSLRLYHLDRQAEIDHEEKGTPLPEHLVKKHVIKAPAPSAPKPPDKSEAVVPTEPTKKSEAVVPGQLTAPEKRKD